MKIILRIARMELQKMFYSPIAWLVLIIFAIQSGIQFMELINSYIRSSEMGYDREMLTFFVFGTQNGFFAGVVQLLYLYIPLITMGLMSKEFSSGSIKLLYSSPISTRQIVLGKYVAVLVFCFVMVGILFVESLYGFAAIKELDFAQILTGLLGIFLLMATYAAIGLFMSSLTSYQIVAAIATFAALFVLQQVGSLWQSIEFVRDITYWLALSDRTQTFINGLIGSEDLLYFIFISGLFIAITIFRLKGTREKSPGYLSVARYAGAFLIVALLGVLTTIPTLMIYYDSTRTKLNTLTENSQKIIAKLNGKVKITTYINVLGAGNYLTTPASQKFDESRYEQYRRFYPNLEMAWKYYYAIPIQEDLAKSHHKRYSGKTMEEIVNIVCNLYDIDPDKVKPAEYYKDEIDLKAELNRFVRKIETEDGQVVHVRIFDDNGVLPYESQNTAAFKTLIEKLPLVGFVGGHGERDVDDIGTRGYQGVTQEKPFRWSLKNNGLDITSLNLDKAVDPKIDILVIAEAKTQFSELEMKNLDEYIDRGGNLIIAADTRRQEAMNPLVERFGVTFLPGQVVEYNKGYTMDLVTSQITDWGKKLAFQFEDIVKGDARVTMPGAVAITYLQKPEFKYTPVMISDSIVNIPAIADAADLAKLKEAYAREGKQLTQNEALAEQVASSIKGGEDKEGDKTTDTVQYKGSWNELQTKDFLDEVAMFESEKGELAGPMTTALALSRLVGTKEQKIMILGDADCFANGEVFLSRKGITANNYSFSNGMFFWMTNGQAPIDIRRPHNPDDKMLIKKDDVGFVNIFYKIIFPALFALAFLLIWLRRKGR